MGIDGIGKGGRPAALPTDGAQAPVTIRSPEHPFQVGVQSKAPSVKPQAVEVTAVATPLEQLRSGAIDVNGYVDAKVEEAVVHLRGLPPAELSLIRRELRDRMATDPSLVELVKSCAGSVPSAQED